MVTELGARPRAASARVSSARPNATGPLDGALAAEMVASAAAAAMTASVGWCTGDPLAKRGFYTGRRPWVVRLNPHERLEVCDVGPVRSSEYRLLTGA